MVKNLEINIPPDFLEDEVYLREKIAKKLKLTGDEFEVHVKRRSLDARKIPVYRLRVEVYIDETKSEPPKMIQGFMKVGKQSAIIIGAGPAGYFAALKLIELGIKPIVLDRGKDVQSRRRDLRAIQQEGIINPDSNYCFGEGGAGTYSDGKLYTRSHKRGNIQEVLNLLVEHGANPNILIDAHPHIGSNKLPGVVKNIRATIEQFGGEIHFDTKVKDLIISKGSIQGAIDQHENEYKADAYILATGHSARDIYNLFIEKKIAIEKKPFAIGVRIEHPQELIDKIQYRQKKRHQNLPASSYNISCQVGGEGVFSFCMCPGGMVVPASTAPGELVVNGMSLSKRDSPYANSGFVTTVSNEELLLQGYDGIKANLNFQSEVEQKMFSYGDGTQTSPAARLVDFAEGKLSNELNKSSYIPGLIAAPMHEILPPFIYNRLQNALLQFGKKIKGYYTNEANVIGVESRTSSPFRIPRNKESFMHPDVKFLFPCGEGAGYAGGILSAAMDGQKVAEKIYSFLNPNE